MKVLKKNEYKAAAIASHQRVFLQIVTQAQVISVNIFLALMIKSPKLIFD
jgi:hypothetical protein